MNFNILDTNFSDSDLNTILTGFLNVVNNDKGIFIMGHHPISTSSTTWNSIVAHNSVYGNILMVLNGHTHSYSCSTFSGVRRCQSGNIAKDRYDSTWGFRNIEIDETYLYTNYERLTGEILSDATFEHGLNFETGWINTTATTMTIKGEFI